MQTLYIDGWKNFPGGLRSPAPTRYFLYTCVLEAFTNKIIIYFNITFRKQLYFNWLFMLFYTESELLQFTTNFYSIYTLLLRICKGGNFFIRMNQDWFWENNILTLAIFFVILGILIWFNIFNHGVKYILLGTYGYYTLNVLLMYEFQCNSN